jgi:hypothetical protein
MVRYKKKLSNLYKSIIYRIFKLIYRKINSSVDANGEDIKLEKIKISKSEYKIYSCHKSKLYTDRVHDTAIIKHNSIIRGPSFQYRNNKNVDCELNVVFSKGTPYIKKKLNGTVLSLLIGGGGNSNYWHWLFDVLPKLFIFQSSKFYKNNIDYYLFPSLDEKFQNETLDVLDIKRIKRLSSKSYRHIEADNIILTSHPYAFLNDPSKDSLNIPKWIFEFLKKNFLMNNIKQNINDKKYSKKIYISRKDGTSLRYIINEKEVCEKLKEHNFEEIILSNHSISDQVKFFYNADFIAGLHGAGFANIIFCKPKTKILELRPSTAGDVIKNIAISNSLDYRDITVKAKSIDHNNQTGDIEVNLKDLENKLLI